MLRQLHNYKTRHSTKKDGPNSTEKYLLTTCIENLAQSKAHNDVTYTPRGLATVWVDKKEVTVDIKNTDIENTLRTTSHSTDLHLYLQTKYKRDDSTIAYIDWLIHGEALQSLFHKPPQNHHTVYTRVAPGQRAPRPSVAYYKSTMPNLSNNYILSRARTPCT
jgi:hypothetical protein